LTCSIESCAKPKACRGWCWTHYDRWRRHGDPHKLGPRGERGTRYIGTPGERFWRYVEKTEACWLWTGGCRSRGGYGNLGNVDGKTVPAHRFSYEMHRGPIPEGLVVDHLCRETKCVNPDHLEAVTVQENSRRAALSRGTARVCGKGHDLTGDAVRTRKDGVVYCGSCANEAQAARRAKYRAERKARRWAEENPSHEAAQLILDLLETGTK
jgi:hypothetical protein